MWMDNAYRVVLFGHRDFCAHRLLDERLCPLLEELIRTKQFVEIYIGRNGEFDLYVATLVKRLQKAMGTANTELICVLPYPMKDMKDYEKYYDRVIIPEGIENSHPKSVITRRNRWIVEQADLFVCYVERTEGGAYAALTYAQKRKKPIINLAERQEGK